MRETGGGKDKRYKMGERHIGEGREKNTPYKKRGTGRHFFQNMGCEIKNGEWMKYG